jgi:enoyl-CoA hydratase/carnithine racemase
LGRDPTCRRIILTGAGQRAFTVGADISGDLSTGPEAARVVNHGVAEKRRLFEADCRRGQRRLRRRRP